MNDVLPKPFTKEGLLNMLEKHLAHLKKQPPGMEQMAPPPAIQTTKRGMKSEESPVTSPATGSTWNSPGNMTGVSPAGSAHDDPYLHAVHNSAGPSPYAVQAPMGQQPMYNASPGGAVVMGPRPTVPAPPQPTQGHRRVISDISGGPSDAGGDAKRQQMYPPGAPQLGPGPPQMVTPMAQQIPRPPGR
jgi:osomolarity two-component system, response regulator SKN7